MHSEGLTPGYQKVIIDILPVEDVSATCLLSQTSLIAIPSSVAPSIAVIPLASTAKEEALQSKVSKL